MYNDNGDIRQLFSVLSKAYEKLRTRLSDPSALASDTKYGERPRKVREKVREKGTDINIIYKRLISSILLNIQHIIYAYY